MSNIERWHNHPSLDICGPSCPAPGTGWDGRGRVIDHFPAPEETAVIDLATFEEARLGTPEPIPDFPGFLASLTADGFTLNPCRDHCQDKADAHVHLHSPSGNDGIIWADGRVSEWDLTQQARLIYPAAGHWAWVPPSLPKDCYQTPGGSMVHVKPACRCPR